MSEEAKSEVQAETTAVDNAAPLKGIVGIKIGMTRAFTEDARMIPVTVISAEGVVVSQVKTKATDGYDAVQIAYDDVKETHLTKAEAQHFAKKGVALKRHVREFRVSDTTPFKVGQAVPVTVFAKGQWLQVSGLTKGHGYAGVIKRHASMVSPTATVTVNIAVIPAPAARRARSTFFLVPASRGTWAT